MPSRAMSPPPEFSGTKEYPVLSLGYDRAESVEAPRSRNRAPRGAITGILLGICLWAAILVLVGVIKF
jgi:hypothetical protein